MIQFEQQLTDLKNRHQFRQIPPLTHHGRYIDIKGQHYLNLSGNDYLGLSYQTDLQKEFLSQYAENLPLFSSTSSRLLTGSSPHYRLLETHMAALFQRESCLLFNSGYHANVGILPALADKQTLILADKLVHASMIDGIRLAGCDFLRFRHNNIQHLNDLLIEHAAHYHRIIIVTESVFSMDGDFADLRALVQLKKHYDHVLLYVDEAHAFGLYGENGLGLAEEYQCLQDIDLLIGTFGKAAASIGAYLISSQEIRDLLINKMRPLIFSTALPPFNIAWTHFIVEKLPQLVQKRQHLHAMSDFLRQSLINQFKVEMPSQSCIVPYIVYDNDKALKLASALQEKGYYCLPIRPPTVPANTARIRFSLNADIQQEELQQLLHCLEELV